MGLGLRAAARELGISHVALLKAEKSGRVARELDGTFDVVKCRVSLERNSNPEKQRQGRSQQKKPDSLESGVAVSVGDEPKETYSEALRVQAWLKVDRDRLENQKRIGSLVELAPINAYVAGMILKARDELTKIAPEL